MNWHLAEYVIHCLLIQDVYKRQIPETMNFQVLFYRKDSLDKLGLEVPDTLEDIAVSYTHLPAAYGGTGESDNRQCNRRICQ